MDVIFALSMNTPIEALFDSNQVYKLIYDFLMANKKDHLPFMLIAQSVKKAIDKKKELVYFF